MTYRPAIDGLRALAVVSVILFHANAGLLPGGFLGVDVFFVISGYLITSILLGGEEDVRPGLVKFYERRVRRIAPAFGLVMTASLIAAWFLLPTRPMRDFGRSLAAAAAFSSNIFFVRNGGYFDVSAQERPLLHTWSLGVEEQFYLLYPMFLYWASRRGLWVLRASLLAGFLASFGLCLMQWGVRPTATFYLLPMRAWELLSGAMLAVAPSDPLRSLRRWASELLGLLALTTLLVLLMITDPKSGTSPWAQMGIVAPTTVILALIPLQVGVTRALAWRPLVAIGVVSYSAYLWHQPMLGFAQMATLHPLGPRALMFLICATFALAGASWRWIEQPARSGVGRPRTVFISAGIGSITLGAVGLGLSAPYTGSVRLRPDVLVLEAKIQRQFDDRERAIRSGTCHFNGTYGPHRVFSGFINEWNCWGSATQRVLVVGDSHAADLALAFRSVGRDVGQMTGAGCSLVPSQMSSTCRRQFDLVRRAAFDHRLQTLVLANRYEPAELTERASREVASYWSWPGVAVWFFTGLPEFRNLMLLRPRAAMLSLDIRSERADTAGSLPSEAFAALLARQIPALRVFNSRVLFCDIEIAAPCTWYAHGEDLIIDDAHFTVAGAAWFGKRLLEGGGVPVISRPSGAKSASINVP